jgi:tRNA(fMet)-specific endonuclease VapC
MPVFQKHTPEQIKVPAIVQGELLAGVRGSRDPIRSGALLDALLRPYEIVPFDSAAAAVYADIRSNLKRSGNMIGSNDLMIAAIVLAHDGILITQNVREFERIPGLRLMDWTHP